MLTREQIRAIYDKGPEAVIELVESLIAQIEPLVARIEKLEAHQSLTSQNSNKPPSSDLQRPKSLRTQSGRKPGGQPGHKGHRLHLAAQADEVVEHRARTCRHCGVYLGQAPHRLWQRRQRIELPVMRPWVIEHRVQACTCPDCGAENRGVFPGSITASVSYGPRLSALAIYLNQYQLLPYGRTAELMRDVLGIGLSSGTLVAMVERASQRLTHVTEAIRAQLLKQPVVHFDETGFYVEAQRQWLHVACSSDWTYYMHHRKRGGDAMKAMQILPTFTARAVHDGHRSYWSFEQCTHGLCNVHHLRSLNFVEERYGPSWARRMKQLLLLIKATVARCKAQEQKHLDESLCIRFRRLYRQLVARGLSDHPPPKRAANKKRGPIKQGKVRNLLLYLERHEAAVLRFMTDFEVPFDNNQAERDIRMMKVKQKVSGAFRSQEGATAFCRIRSYISTLRKQEHDVINALMPLFDNQYPFPHWATE